MKLRLQNTSYVDFDSWLRLRIDILGFVLSYDQEAFRDNKQELNLIPQQIYPLMIFLHKKMADGRFIGPDVVLIGEKIGLDLIVVIKVFTEVGKSNLKPLLLDISQHWVETLPIVHGFLQNSSNKNVTQENLTPEDFEKKFYKSLELKRKTLKGDLEASNELEWMAIREGYEYFYKPVGYTNGDRMLEGFKSKLTSNNNEKRKPGHPYDLAHLWAFFEMRDNGRDPEKVKPEWYEFWQNLHPGQFLQDPNRQFFKIKKKALGL